MKTLINRIAKKAVETSGIQEFSAAWNRKFYTYNNGNTVIYINNEKIDVTKEVDELRREDGTFYSTPITDAYSKLVEELIDLRYDFEDEGKTEIKKELLKQIS